MMLRYKFAFLLTVIFFTSQVFSQNIGWSQLSLTDYNGKPFSQNSLNGHPVLLNFVFTGCSASCSMQTRSLSNIRRALPADVSSHIKFVSVSLDPLADTPSVLKQYAIKHDAFEPGWWFLHSEPPSLEKLLRQVEGPSAGAIQKSPTLHSGTLYLFGADGAMIQRYMGLPPNEKRLIQELTQFIRSPKNKKIS